MIAKYLSILLLVSAGLGSGATPVSYFSVNGAQLTNNAQLWGGSDRTTSSVTTELVFDLTLDMQTSGNPYTLWSAGGNGVGADLVYEAGNLHFWAGSMTSHVASGPIGISALKTDVQVVTVFSIDDSATDDRLQIFVNGVEIANVLHATGNKWAGANAGGVGVLAGTDTHRYSGTGLFTEANMTAYPNANITFDAYLHSDPSYDLNAILVPEPSAIALIFLGLGIVAVKRTILR